MNSMLVLEDGTIFEGQAFGAQGEAYGEIVFNTSMTGYQEILTDPSYKGQIVTMTYPLIGNYGINTVDIESGRPQVEGFVVKELSSLHSNWRSETCLDHYLKEHNIIALEGIDTRALTRHIRSRGAMKAVISTIDHNRNQLIEKVKKSSGLIGHDLVQEVSCKNMHEWKQGNEEWSVKQRYTSAVHIVAIDCGIKQNILRIFVDLGCKVTVVPPTMSAREILGLQPDGIFLSNGPGDPEPITYVIETVRALIEQKPIFGICLGHQLLGLALGGKTYKLKFGHRGANHPVKDLKTGKIEITSQNHGFCVASDSLDQDKIEITHINLNDQTVEGLQHKQLPAFSVQYHPEASPGPHDSLYLFDRFIELIKNHQTTE